MQRQNTGGRAKAFVALGLSLAAAVVAVVLVLNVVRVAQEEVARAQQAPDPVYAVIAARDLNVGVPITEEDVVLRALVPEMVPAEGTFDDMALVVGRTPRERVLANEILRDARLAAADAGIGLNAIVSPGRRAMAVAVDSESGVAGFIQPGNYVDVIVTIRPDDGARDRSWVSHAFLQGVKVLAVGRNVSGGESEQDLSQRSRPARDKPTVTLELDLEQAQAMALSASKGDIHLVLRNDIDITEVTTQGVLTSNLVGTPPQKATPRRRATAAAPAPAPVPAGPVSEVIHGDRVEEVKFEADGSKTITVSGSKRR